MAFRLIKEKNEINEDVKGSVSGNSLSGSGLFTGFIPIASGTFRITYRAWHIPAASRIGILLPDTVTNPLLFIIGVYYFRKNAAAVTARTRLKL